MGMAQKTGMDRSAGDPDVWIGLDHLRFGMDHGVWIACGTGVWIGTLHFEPQPYIYIYIYIRIYKYIIDYIEICSGISILYLNTIFGLWPSHTPEKKKCKNH